MFKNKQNLKKPIDDNIICESYTVKYSRRFNIKFPKVYLKSLAKQFQTNAQITS